MTNLTVKSFDAPEETRTPDKTRLEGLDVGGAKAARLTVQPGWRWSECIKPVVGGEEPVVGYEFETTPAATYATYAKS